MKNFSIKLTLFALFLLAMLPISAQAQLYGVSLNGHNSSSPGPSSLYLIDPVTGAGTLIGDIGYAVNAIAVDPTSGILYGSETQWVSWTASSFLQIDPITGAGTPIGVSGTGCCRGLTFDSTGQLWGWTESGDDPVKIDKTTGLATVVGNAGVGTGGQVMSFDSTDTLFMVQGTNVYIIDQITGAAVLDSSLSFDPGSGGADFGPTSGLLWNARGSGQTQDAFIRLTNIAGNSFSDMDTDVEYLNAVTFGDAILPEVARFKVTKTFSDNSTDDVDVTLTCTTGLPLTQTTTIAGGDPTGVTFVVTDLLGSVDCEVTESGSPSGYTPVFNGGAGCAWSNVVASLNTCEISNLANDATFTATKQWEIINDGGDFVDLNVPVTISCDAMITSSGGYDAGDGWWHVTQVLGDGDSMTAKVKTTLGPANCRATENITQSGVEASDNCGLRSLSAGSSDSCTFINTVFFEGIPTLSQYGLAILALLMLGVGMVGFRRFA